MRRARAGGRHGRPLQPPASSHARSGVASCPLSPRKWRAGWGAAGRLRVLFLLVFWVSLCKGAPMASNVLQEQDLQLWNEIDDVCSAYLARDAQPQSSNALEELCFMVLGLLQKTQGLDEKENSKRFLFHYSKTHDTGNSDFLSSVLHPLLQLVPQLYERRPKRYKVDIIYTYTPLNLNKKMMAAIRTLGYLLLELEFHLCRKNFEYLEEFKVGDTLSSGYFQVDPHLLIPALLGDHLLQSRHKEPRNGRRSTAFR